eukprot:scaffold11296_cov157-Skeletonema_menzelii.AAC.1
MVATRQLIDQVVLHIIKHVLEKDNDMVICFKEAGLTNIVDIMSMSDSHLKKVKFKNGDETTAPRITSAEESELKLIPSYINWEQNNYATLPDNPVDLIDTASRYRFNIFLCLDANGRQGNTDGTVSYSHTVAFESERRNR